MSTVALSRNPSKPAALWNAVAAFVSPFVRQMARTRKSGRDRRVLQLLPDHVLADIGLEKIEIAGGTDGSRHVWVIPHRYY